MTPIGLGYCWYQQNRQYRIRFEEVSPLAHPDLWLRPVHPITVPDQYWQELIIYSDDLRFIVVQCQNKTKLMFGDNWPKPYVRNVQLEQRINGDWRQLKQESGVA